MEVYADRAIRKAEKQIDKKMRRAFRVNDYEDICLQRFATYYKYSGEKVLTFKDDLDKVRDTCFERLHAFRDEIVRGAGSIYLQAVRNVNSRLKSDGAPYRVTLNILTDGATPRFYVYDYSGVDVKAHLSFDIEFIDPAEIIDKKKEEESKENTENE